MHRLSDPVVQSDPKQLREAGKRLKDLEPLVQTYQRYRSSIGDLAVAREMFGDAEGDDRDAMRAEVDDTEHRIAELE